MTNTDHEMNSILFCASSRTGFHGGTNRSSQLLELLSEIAEVELVGPIGKKEAMDARRNMKAVLSPGFIPSMIKWLWIYSRIYDLRTSIGSAIRCIHRRRDAKQQIYECGRPSLIAIEYFKYFLDLTFSKSTDCIVMGFPQNIDALAQGNFGKQRKHLRQLKHEISMYRRCNAVFTISQEEAWFLRNAGVNVYYLPYIPPQNQMTIIQNVAQLRKNTSARHNLLLSTTKNLPTKHGTLSFLNHIHDKKVSFNLPLVVAGGGTAEHCSSFASENVKVLGKVTNETLIDLLAQANTLIIPQEWGTGALTRVIDWALAGINIVCTRHAARSVPYFPNVHICNDINDMIELINSPLPRYQGVQDVPEEFKESIEYAKIYISSLLKK
ncbi:MAG: hypothetical protein JXD22_16855 [Sedimentisphaerales bacterium]|nr:hypothetical protein [Sedimentisphaerales bacterium]